MIRLSESKGGFAAIVHKGDPDSGVIWLQITQRGQFFGLFHQSRDESGQLAWIATRPQDVENHQALDLYIQKQRHIDPDLWLIELDVPDAAQFTAESIAFD